MIPTPGSSLAHVYHPVVILSQVPGMLPPKEQEEEEEEDVEKKKKKKKKKKRWRR